MNPSFRFSQFPYLIFGVSVLLLPLASQAAVPQVLNHQGRLAVNGVNFDGSGQFKFALVNSSGSVTYWSNDGTSSAGSQPTVAVALAVSRGLYAALLGDTTLPNMTAVPTSVFENADVRLRVWFNDGSNGFQLLTPDQRLAASPYALTADKANSATSATGFSGSLAGEVSGPQGATAIAAAAVTGKPLTGFVSGAGTLSSTDTLLSAINKLDANVGLRAPLASPTFTGTTSGSFSGPLSGNATTATSATSFTGSLAGDVTGTQGATAISAATVTGKALTGFASTTGPLSAADTVLSAISKLNGNDGLKAPLASPSFTGTVSGITATMVGLANVDNTSDAGKPVSTAQQTALNLKANLASPTFTGTVTLPAGGASAAPLRLATGTNLTAAVFGSIEFDGTNLYLTNNSATPTRKTIAYTDSAIASAAVGSSQLAPGLTLGGTTTGTFSGPLTGNATSATSFTGSLAGDVTGTQSATAISAATVTGKALTGFASTTGPLSAADTVLSAINKLNGNDGLKANLASPAFTGTVSGITATMVGLANVDNTSDAGKPVSTAQQAALNMKANLANPTFTGTVTLPAGGISAAPLRLATGTNLTAAVFGSIEFDGTNLYLTNNSATPTRKTIAYTDSPIASAAVGSSQLAPGLTLGGTTTGTFSGPLTGNVTGNVSGSATSFSGSLLGDVTGTQGATAISAATVTGKALTGYVSGAGTLSATDTVLTAINKLNGNDALKANIASPTFTGTTTGTFSGPLTGNVTGSATSFTGSLVGDVTGTQSATVISAATVTGKALTGYVSGAGTLSATDTVLTALNKLNGNDALKANLASPTFTGTVGGITASMVGLGNVSNTSDASKPVSTAQQTALDLKASLASPTFTGTVGGITASMVGLANVTNTADSAKPVSTSQQAALDLKSNTASPTFSGTVSLAAGTALSAPLKLAAGTSLSSVSFGAVEFDGANLYLTTNSASPTRKTLAFTDSVPPLVPMTSLTAAPIVPVLAWGNNGNGQTSLPALANVAAVAAGQSHSLVLLDAGTVVARGLNTSGQVTVPAGLTGVTEIAAGTAHNLVRKSDGTLVAWGDNAYGQTTLPGGITTATRVAAGEKHSLALLANGSVRAWGDNSFGQTTLPASLTGATVTAIAAGSDHSLALKSDGTVIAWGRDDAAQVTLPSGLVNVVAIAAGAYHSLALKSDGTVIAWGWDGGGQVTIPAGLSGISKIAGGYAFSMALKTDGTVVLWGDNSDNQTKVPAAATQVTHIAAGASHALALRADAIAAQVARLDQDNVFTGKLGIKRTPEVNSLEVEGAASKTTAGSWLSNSDRRIKTEIQSITGALEKLEQVHLVDFRYTDEYRAAHPSIEDVRYPNVIAQEFAGVFPADVKSSGELMADGSPILQVDTYPLIIYSAAAVQELNQENQTLKKQLADQEKRLRKLEALLGE